MAEKLGAHCQTIDAAIGRNRLHVAELTTDGMRSDGSLQADRWLLTAQLLHLFNLQRVVIDDRAESSEDAVTTALAEALAETAVDADRTIVRKTAQSSSCTKYKGTE